MSTLQIRKLGQMHFMRVHAEGKAVNHTLLMLNKIM